MMQFLIAAPFFRQRQDHCRLRSAGSAEKRGSAPCAFKCGPDYIDPMFHRSALQVDSHNLDLFLSDRDTVRAFTPAMPPGMVPPSVRGLWAFTTGRA